jgi:hypothetical protein
VGTLSGLTVTAPIVGSITGNAETATTATNIVGGANGSIPYQTGSGATSLLAAGTNGQVLTLTGGVPTWAAASGATSFANPTGSIGLTAVNGSASTAMRSDATPAISQAIIPSWSGLHTFTGGITSTGTATLSLGADASAQTINLGTGGAVKSVTIGSTNTTSSTTINGGSAGSGSINLVGHINTSASSAPTITVGSGTGAALATGSTDNAGLVTSSGNNNGNTTVVITFAKAFTNPPFASIIAANLTTARNFRDSNNPVFVSTTTTKMTVTFLGASAMTFSYVLFGN